MALVLIVDDSPTEVHVLGGYLKKHGFDIAAAADGREGIDKARILSPDLILMDVVMPGMNGFQATRELARAPDTASIPVVMVTTKGLETDRIWGLRQGARDYLVKPVSEAQLVAKVRAVLEQTAAGEAGAND
ncbi:response regulator [Thioalkalivibrio sp. XN8]|uniref:response regulator transcription factor n=1 Tax=Thioalkalivibrio sp. XN8 TaxID=2712863 RepID=UPI0013EC923E|nr:response regulator [Thioalkalivibrio sp. XN8]NGP52743.1 response regulator [Thioalkalivibrio sp. XN8]